MGRIGLSSPTPCMINGAKVSFWAVFSHFRHCDHERGGPNAAGGYAAGGYAAGGTRRAERGGRIRGG
jgi:hypothetical protein